ncbi:MAG: profilin domain protein [Candidatus Woesearchaeota archaeon]
MEPKKVTINTLRKLVDQLQKGSEKAIGSFLYKGFHIQISRYKLSTSERVSQLYHRRRSEGRCILCGKKVTRKNPRTKRLYRLCDEHRKKVDRR